MCALDAFGIEWNRRPTKEEMEHVWRVMRPPQKGTMRLLVLSGDLTGTYTHFWHGRTTPCKREHCEACQASRMPEWHGYLACLQADTKIRWILEVTKGCAKNLDDWFRERRTLRGTLIEVGRTSAKPNGRQFVRCLSQFSEREEMLKAPDLHPILARMWQQREQPLFNHAEGDDQIKIANTDDAKKPRDGDDPTSPVTRTA